MEIMWNCIWKVPLIHLDNVLTVCETQFFNLKMGILARYTFRDVFEA
jgi:hypothetical protein